MKKFDIAPFALPQCPQGEIRFEEPRDIERVEVTFSGAPPRNPSIEYLRRIWPGERFERSPDADQLRPAPYGWMRIDDHFHSEWTRAATDLKRECARTVAFTLSMTTGC